MQTRVADLDAAQLAVSDASAPEGTDDRLAPDVDTDTHGTEFADVEVDCAWGDSEFGHDQLLALAFREAERDRLGGRSGLRFASGEGEALKGGVLLGCRVFDASQLVHLQERALWLGDVNLKPLAAGGIERDPLVLYGLVKYLPKQGELSSDRRRAERAELAIVDVTKIGAGSECVPQLVRLFDQVLLERFAEFLVDFIDGVATEEGQQVQPQRDLVAGVRVLGNRLLADNTFELCLQPIGGVLVEARHSLECLLHLRRRLRSLPYSCLDASEDVL
ncbi:MAG: hypothetical protein WA484_16715 [Solirubrobacteraceae bacterium]